MEGRRAVRVRTPGIFDAPSQVPHPIAPELQGRIFERFFRGHPNAAEGTGLGLPIVQAALQQLDSRIKFESDPATGTSFRFLLSRPAEDETEA